MATSSQQPPNESLEDTSAGEESQQQDWQVPLTFMRARHVLRGEEREVTVVNSDSWRVKDRVSFGCKTQFALSLAVMCCR